MALLKRNHSFWGAEILPLIREVGYLKPTVLQRDIIPLILKGKDVAVEAEEGSGKTAAFILPLIVSLKRGKPGIKAVVLTSSLENSRKIFREFCRFLPPAKDKLALFAFGLVEDQKKENRILYRTPDVMIGTPDRFIDHIRRGNLDFSQLRSVVVDEPRKGELAGFGEDVEFIFSKFPQNRQTLLFSPAFDGGTDPLYPYLKRPVVVTPHPTSEEVYITAHKLTGLYKLILTEKMESVLILCRDKTGLKTVVRGLKSNRFRVLYLHDALEPQKQKAVLKTFSEGFSSILVGTFSAVKNHRLNWVSHIICIDLPPDPGAFHPEGYALQEIFFLVASEEQLIELQEMRKVKMKRQDFPGDEQVYTVLIKNALKKIKEEEDPFELNRFRRIMKRNVPIFLRSYFSAYLLKTTLKIPSKEKEQFTKLFVSVGKNRRVFPRDLVNLFANALMIERSMIGEITVMDNYSFIELHFSYADRAIKELTGTEYKGRKITVNFARKKRTGNGNSNVERPE